MPRFIPLHEFCACFNPRPIPTWMLETLRDRPSKLWIVGPTGLSKPLPSWLYMKSSFGKSTSEAHIFKIVWSSWPQTMEMKDLRRKSKGSWTRMSGMQLALRRLDGLAFPMVPMILGLAEHRFWKACPASQAPIVTSWKYLRIIENHGSRLLGTVFACALQWTIHDNYHEFSPIWSKPRA